MDASAEPHVPGSERLSVETLTTRLQPRAAPLHAVVDGARSSRVLALLRTHHDEHASLFEGLQGEVLAPHGPYLVRFAPDSGLLAAWLAEGWGRSWGIFVHTTTSFRHLRRHFRRLLMVETEAGKRLYFRFYDPRVLRAVLPLLTPRQNAQVFAEVDALVCEGESPADVLRFVLPGAGPATGHLT